MKKFIIILFGVVAMLSSVHAASAADVGFSLGVDLGNIGARFYAPPRVVFDEPPRFVAGPGPGFSIAVGTPYDLFYAGDSYYLSRGGMWYAAPYYNGPWVQVGYRTLPWALRRYPVARLRHFSDENRDYRGGYGYGYGHFRPEMRGGWGRHARWDNGRSCGTDHYRYGMRSDDYDD